MSVIGILLIMLALALGDWAQLRSLLGRWRHRGLSRRFGRLVSRGADAARDERADGEGLLGAVRLLRRIDPTFPPTEDALRGLGFASLQLALAVEGAKMIVALALGVSAALLVGPRTPHLAWIAGFIVFFLGVMGLTLLIKRVVRNRRRQLGRELITGVDLLTIFLEGGQSLEQAFRALGDVAGPALPALAGIQRALIGDLESGVPFEKALDRWATGIGSEPAQVLSALFKETLLHGTELVPQLRRFSTDLLERRLIAARESIGRKSAQLTMVMVAFFLPAILLFIGGPAFVGLISGLKAMR